MYLLTYLFITLFIHSFSQAGSDFDYSLIPLFLISFVYFFFCAFIYLLIYSFIIIYLLIHSLPFY